MIENCELIFHSIMIYLSNLKKTVLAVELTRLGDTISAIPAINALKEADCELKIVVLTQPQHRDIFAYNPNVERVMVFPKTDTIFGLLKTIYNIRKEKFGLAISLSPAKRNAVITYFSKAKYKVGYFALHSIFPAMHGAKVRAFGFRPKRKILYRKDENLVERALKSIKALGANTNHFKKEIDIPESEINYIRDYIVRISKNPKIISMQPCSSWKYRDWPKENFIKLINALQGYAIFLLGAKKDEGAINEIIIKTGKKAHPFINMPLIKVAALIKESNLFIGPDSGLMHIADAVGSPLITLFGPSKPEVTGPLSKKATIISKEAACAPCWQRGICVKSPNCMELITAEEVLKKIQEMPGSYPIKKDNLNTGEEHGHIW